MNRMRPAAPQRAETSDPSETVRGVLTGVPLDDVRRLQLPLAYGPFGYLRPPLDATALRLSLELAYMTYSLNLDPWMRAGWTDISIQVDNHLQSGVTVGYSESAASERIRGLMNAWKVGRARMALRAGNPVTQIMAALRQREHSDTLKAVTMVRPARDGRYVVAIGFMGTGSRFYDWFSNFRFTTEKGFHKGFLQLTECFEQSAGRILFPDTAAALKRNTLTLADILAEMRTPDSRFSLWMAGHSQGAAVMQLFCHRLLCDYGVLSRHMVGYGFASPTAAAAVTGRDPAAYPLFHIINTDDIVPRIGALTHLGLCLPYQADEALRAAAYGWDDSPEEQALRAQAETLFAHIADTPTMLETLAACYRVVDEEKTEENLNALLEKHRPFAPLDRALGYAENRVKASLDRMARYTRVAYHAVTGQRMDEAVVARLMEDMRPVVRALPLRRLLGGLSERYRPPHMLCREHLQPGAYSYIAMQGLTKLRPCIWREREGGLPVRVYADGTAVFTPDPEGSGKPRKRRPAPVRGVGRRSVRSLGVGRRRAARGACAPCAARVPARVANRSDTVRGWRRFWPRGRHGARNV